MGGHGKGWLRIAIEDWIETYGIGKKFGAWLQEKADDRTDDLLTMYKDFITEFGLENTIPKSLQPKSPIAIAGLATVGIPILVSFCIGIGMSLAQAALAPFARAIGYRVDRSVNSGRIDLATSIRAFWRDIAPDGDWNRDYEDLGFTDERMGVVEEVSRPRPGISELLAMELRNITPEGHWVEEGRAQGWTDQDMVYLKRLTEIIPAIPDLITMAVREAWRDDIAERFKYDDDFPTQVVEWAEKQGLSEEWVKRYWRAHWVLPSISQGFEMFHRLRPGTTDVPFTMDDLMTMLRTADIPEFFRARLREVAYMPLTRVDVRRMFGTGVLSREEVKASYLDLGYNDINAERMTEFTIRYETQEQRDLTRSVIVDAYQRSVMKQDEARAAIIDIGYTVENADLFLAIADTKIAERRAKDRLDRAEFMYVEGLIDESGVYAEIGDLNLPADQIADLIVSWDIAKLKKISLATKSELEDLYKRDIIDRDELNDGLMKRRYDDVTIGWYTERLDMRVAEDATKDMERAQKEQERIERAKFASVYQRVKAGMEVEIAAIKLQIADIKLAVNYMTVAADIKLAKETIFALKRDIAEWQLAKAEIKMEFTEAPTE